MAVSLTDRLTQAIRVAEQSMQHAQFQADYRNWHEVHRVLQDARDELGKTPLMAATFDETAKLASLEFVAEQAKRKPGRPSNAEIAARKAQEQQA